MDARTVGWHIAQCVVQYLDMKCCALEEIRFAQILERGVVRHGQIGTVELQYEARIGDRFVFFLHRGGDRFDVSLVRRVVPVGLKYGNETR